MNSHEQKRAEALDVRLEDCQSGRSVNSQRDRADGEGQDFLAELVALAGAQGPDPGFTAELESRLLTAARKRLTADRHSHGDLPLHNVCQT